jgi:arylsulfatase A-like enzyme
LFIFFLFFFDTGVKVPAFVSGGILPDAVRGSISHELYHVTDWLPTIVDVASRGTVVVKKNGGQMIDGMNIWKSISTGTSR